MTQSMYELGIEPVFWGNQKKASKAALVHLMKGDF
jgi:hypothetical protein